MQTKASECKICNHKFEEEAKAQPGLILLLQKINFMGNKLNDK